MLPIKMYCRKESFFMRMRRKPWARPELEACPFYVKDPAAYRGRWQTFFPKAQPLHLELGCGKGVFLAQLAVVHPEINYIGVDIKSEVLASARRNLAASYDSAGLSVDNVAILSQDIERIFMMLAPEDVVERIYINFCNPWPTGSRHKKRLTHSKQLAHYQTFLRPGGEKGLGGEIWFKTDDDALFQDSLTYFAACGFSLRYLTWDLYNSGFIGNIPTEHEMKFVKEGIPIKFCIALAPPNAPTCSGNPV